MLIALDHDGTYTLDPEFWDGFIDTSFRHGHAVHIVTLRDADKDRLASEQHLSNMGCMIIYCDGHPKLEVATERGYYYDIWIEDDPLCVDKGSRLTPEELEVWRAQDKYRATPNKQHGEERASDSVRRPRLFSRRSGRGGGSFVEREPEAQSGGTSALGQGEIKRSS